MKMSVQLFETIFFFSNEEILENVERNPQQSEGGWNSIIAEFMFTYSIMPKETTNVRDPNCASMEIEALS